MIHDLQREVRERPAAATYTSDAAAEGVQEQSTGDAINEAKEGQVGTDDQDQAGIVLHTVAYEVRVYVSAKPRPAELHAP